MERRGKLQYPDVENVDVITSLKWQYVMHIK